MRRVLIIFFVLPITFLNACNGITKDDKTKIEDIVRKYNNGLMKAFNDEDFSILQPVCTEKEFNKVKIYVQSYTAAGEKLFAELMSLQFKDMRKKDKKGVEVFTLEAWRYSRSDIETGKTLVPSTLYEYEMKYTVVYEKNKGWRIAGLKVMNERKREL